MADVLNFSDLSWSELLGANIFVVFLLLCIRWFKRNVFWMILHPVSEKWLSHVFRIDVCTCKGWLAMCRSFMDFSEKYVTSVNIKHIYVCTHRSSQRGSVQLKLGVHVVAGSYPRILMHRWVNIGRQILTWSAKCTVYVGYIYIYIWVNFILYRYMYT